MNVLGIEHGTDVIVETTHPLPPHYQVYLGDDGILSLVDGGIYIYIPEVKLNCLTLPTLPSPSTGWALATMWEAILGARVCQSMTAARNRRGAATGDSISWVQLLVDAIAVTSSCKCKCRDDPS